MQSVLLMLLLLCCSNNCCVPVVVASSSINCAVPPGDADTNGDGGVCHHQADVEDDDADDETIPTGSSPSSPPPPSSPPLSLEDELDRAVHFRAFLKRTYAQLDEFYYANAGRATHFDLQRHALRQWLRYFGMDPTATMDSDHHHQGQSLRDNWLETLYRKTTALAPTVLFSVWSDINVDALLFANDDDDEDGGDDHYGGGPTDDELQILLALDPSPLRNAEFYDPETDELVLDRPQLLRQLLEPFRHRGAMPRSLAVAWRNLFLALETVSHAIPSTQNLELLSRYAPLIEVGAGTGYWSAAVQMEWLKNNNNANNSTTNHGEEMAVLAYDAFPPEPPTVVGQRKSLYFEHTYTDVRPGTCLDVFGGSGSSSNNATTMNDAHSNSNKNNNRTLLLVWPNNPDNVDNSAQFHSDALPPVWDADCVRAYVRAGGTTVILVAERQVNIPLMTSGMAAAGHRGDGDKAPPPPPIDFGLSATRELQAYLRDNFDLVERQPVLSWYYRDDLTVWRLKRKPEQQQQQAKSTTTATTMDQAAAAVDSSNNDNTNENIIINNDSSSNA